jgi:hypothetical protein
MGGMQHDLIEPWTFKGVFIDDLGSLDQEDVEVLTDQSKCRCRDFFEE